MWMSLICTMVKPSRSGGRPAMGTSTVTTRASRRALTKPTMVAASASVATHQAEACRSAVQPNSRPARLASHRISSSASRSTVKTNSDENRPIVISPTQAIRSPQGGRAEDRASMPSGIRMQDSASASTAAAALGP